MQSTILKSKRKYPYLGLIREDDNVFFTTLALRIVKDFELTENDSLKSYEEEVFDQFIEVINGAKLYQFWKREPHAYFPNGYFMHRFDMFKAPPDADTTGLIYYVKDHKPADIEPFFGALRFFSNTSTKSNHNAKPAYQNKKIFSTWFGSGKMPIEFDLVVLLNLFYALEKYGYPMDEYYKDSIFFIKNEITTSAYIDQPFYSSPWYASTVLLYYHIARFIYFHPGHELASLTSTLLEQLEMVRARAKSSFDRMLIDSALMFLDEDDLDEMSLDPLEEEVTSYSAFLASMLALVPGRVAWRLAQFKLFQIRFVCQQYNRMLIQENLEMRKLRSS